MVEDEAAFAQKIRENLTEAGFVTDHAADGNKGWLLGDTQSYDAAILDLGLPTLSGLEILKRWRQSTGGSKWKFLRGTGKRKGITGGGEFVLLMSGKPIVTGKAELCEGERYIRAFQVKWEARSSRLTSLD